MSRVCAAHMHSTDAHCALAVDAFEAHAITWCLQSLLLGFMRLRRRMEHSVGMQVSCTRALCPVDIIPCLPNAVRLARPSSAVDAPFQRCQCVFTAKMTKLVNIIAISCLLSSAITILCMVTANSQMRSFGYTSQTINTSVDIGIVMQRVEELRKMISYLEEDLTEARYAALVNHTSHFSSAAKRQGSVPQHLQEHLKAQFGQDKYMYETYFYNKSSPGFFVEFGGRNGVWESNTHFFEKALGWKGLLVEAVEDEYKQLVNNRPNSIAVNSAVCASNGTIEFMISTIPGWHGIVGSYSEGRKNTLQKMVRIPCITLEHLLSVNKVKHVDYMTVDTEGSEYDILRVFPTDHFDIDFIQVEMLTGNSKKAIALVDLMRSKGYKLVHIFDGGPTTVDFLLRHLKP